MVFYGSPRYSIIKETSLGVKDLERGGIPHFFSAMVSALLRRIPGCCFLRITLIVVVVV
jgi:hypothetical protein